MDPDEILDDIFQLVQKIESGEAPPSKLETLLKKISRQCEDPSEIYEESYELFSEMMNDAEFRADEIGEHAVKNNEVFRLVYKYCCPGDENIELVLATSPYCPIQILEKLAESDYAWEEDGTTQSLARNQHNPDLLKNLGKSFDSSTRYFVAMNPATPIETLSELSKDNDVCNSYVYFEKFDKTESEKNRIKYAVIINPNTPDDLLKIMLEELTALTNVDTSEIPKSDVLKLISHLNEKLQENNSK